MTLEDLHAIVRANIVCRNPGERFLQAELIERNYMLPILIICSYAPKLGHSQREIANFLDITMKEVKGHQDKLKDLKIDLEGFPEYHIPFKRKIDLVENGIRLHEFGIRAGEYFERIFSQ